MMRGQFIDGQPVFEPFEPKPVDTRHLQGAMFLDRPDLWKKHPRCSRQVPKEQLALIYMEEISGYILDTDLSGTLY